MRKPSWLFLVTSFILMFSWFIVAFTLYPLPLSPSSSSNALIFNNGDYIEVPNSKSLNINGSLTVQFWVKSFESETGRLLTKGSYSECNYFISWRSDGFIEFYVTNDENGEWKNYILVPAIELNKWAHLTFIYDKDSGKMLGYVNGEIAIGESVGSFRLRNGEWAVKIGKGEDNTSFHGLISDILIFNRVLSPAEIRENMRGNTNTASEGLVGWWKFGEGSGNRTVDSSTSHNDGVIYGAKWSRPDEIDLYLRMLFADNASRVILTAGVSLLSIGFPWVIGEFLVIHSRSFGRLITKPRISRVVVHFKKNPSCVPIIFGIVCLVIAAAESEYNMSLSEESLSYMLWFLLIGILLQFIEFASTTMADEK
jgi:hypothetical protein